jgi:hypothetical protein
MSDRLAPAPGRSDSDRVQFATTYRQVVLQRTSSALRIRNISKTAIKMCIGILENTYTHTIIQKRLQYQFIASTCQRLPAIKCTTRNSLAQLVALQDGATSLHVYALPAPRRDLRPSSLGSPSCRETLRISVAQKARFARV